MKALIIEDELPAQVQLERLINSTFPAIEVIGRIDSVKGAIRWLNESQPDLIFMDVELSDGQCFEIFRHVTVHVPVIITTAYSNYAIQAFKVNSIDYLLKPIDKDEFTTAVNKAIKSQQHQLPDFSVLEEILKQRVSPAKEYKQRFTVKVGDRILIIPMGEIAYFYAEEKVTFIVTHENKRYITDYTLDALEEQLNPKLFFRLSRGCIAHIESIKSVSKYFNSRLKITLSPPSAEEILVSRIRIPQFMSWLDGE